MNDALKHIVLGLAGGIVPPVAKARRTAIGGVAIAVFAVTAYVALIGALWFALLPRLGPAYAWLVIAGLAGLGALIAWGIAAILNARAKARAEAERSAAMQALITEAAATALFALPRLVRDHPFVAMLAAAGLAFATVPKGQAEPPEDDKA